MSIVSHIATFAAGWLFCIAAAAIKILWWSQYYNSISSKSQNSSFLAGCIEESDVSGLGAYKSGWLIVSSGIDSVLDADPDASLQSSFTMNGSELNVNDSTHDNVRPGAQRLYGILKHGNLFLHRDESCKDVKQVVVLSHNFVTIWPYGKSDALLFTKTSRIAIVDPFRAPCDYNDLGTLPQPSFYIHTDIAPEKEDWYFALVRATKVPDNKIPYTLSPDIHAHSLHFSTQHMLSLIQNLHSTEGQLHTRWLNALIGRLFLSLQLTDALEQYLRGKISKKLQKIKKPGFLDEFTIKSIYTGNSAPIISFPELREISPLGSLLVAASLAYRGCLSLEISTKANLGVLGARFKPREVEVVLRITLQSIEGHILINMKPPPSARLWYSFEEEPKMVLKIEPVIQSRQFSYNIITKSIEKKLKEVIRESIVLPYWDDIAFFNTMNQIYRGGIWKAPPPSSSENSPVSSENHLETESDPEAERLGISNDLVPEISCQIRHRSTNSKLAKATISNTLNDISKLIQKQKLLEDMGLDCERRTVKPTNAYTTFKKMNKWYYKDDKLETSETYVAPEMISNRRVPRKLSCASSSSVNSTEFATVEILNSPTYDFSKASPGKTISTSRRNRSFSTDAKKFESLYVAPVERDVAHIALFESDNPQEEETVEFSQSPNLSHRRERKPPPDLPQEIALPPDLPPREEPMFELNH